MDELDIASEREQISRDAAIADARSHADEHPDVGCNDCYGANNEWPHGKECPHYTGCLQDWERKNSAAKREGKKGE